MADPPGLRRTPQSSYLDPSRTLRRRSISRRGQGRVRERSARRAQEKVQSTSNPCSNSYPVLSLLPTLQTEPLLLPFFPTPFFPYSCLPELSFQLLSTTWYVLVEDPPLGRVLPNGQVVAGKPGENQLPDIKARDGWAVL